MWSYRYFPRMDIRVFPIVAILMSVSLLVISSMTMENEGVKQAFMTIYAKQQLRWFFVGWVIFFLCAGLDYNKLREWTWILYLFLILMLIGLYFTNPIQNVQRWYRVPLVGISIQPSEFAKLILVLTLGWFLEKNGQYVHRSKVALQVLVIVGIPFLLILKQPDLGTALVLYPITLGMCYFGGIDRRFFRFLSFLGIVALFFVSSLFTGILSHEKMKPFFTTFMKEYQYERLNPNTYHQKAAQTALAMGGITGSGFRKSDFSSKKWLPAAHTDSVFSAFGEEFGLLGIGGLCLLFYALIYLCFQVTAVAKDPYGRLLSSGLAIYLTMHVLVNILMMCGFLPISGVPLILITYGGNSMITTMAALGILQSIYSRRFMF